MADSLYEVLLEKKTELIHDIIHQLKHSSSIHYMKLDWDILLERVESLVAYFLISLRGTPGQFVKYVSEMAEERIAEGYCVSEVLMALRLLEEKAWVAVVQGVPREDQINSLSRVTGTIGAAKDQLAIIFVSHREKED